METENNRVNIYKTLQEYYTPKPEHLHINYTCEIKHEKWMDKGPYQTEWVKSSLSEEGLKKALNSLLKQNNEEHNIVRTPYLNLDQLQPLFKEDKGWKLSRGGSYHFNLEDTYISPNWLNGHKVNKIRVLFHPKDQWVQIVFWFNGEKLPEDENIMFEGQCTSINEFKTACRLTGLAEILLK